MMYQFTVFHDGGSDVLSLDLAHTETARVEDCKLLEQATRAVLGVERRDQVRVVVSDDQARDLFTIAFYRVPARGASVPSNARPAMT